MARKKADGRRAKGIQSKKGLLYIVITTPVMRDGKRHYINEWIATSMADTQANIKKASAMREKLLNKSSAKSIDRNISTKDFIEIFLNRKHREVANTTYAGYLHKSKHISDYFSTMKLKDIRERHVEQFLDQLFIQKQLCPRTVKDIKVLFTQIFEMAIKEGVVTYNQVKDVIISKNLVAEYSEKKDTADSFFSYEEAQQFLQFVEDHELYELFYFTLFFGLRREEVLGLSWSSIDLENKRFQINHTVTKGTSINRLNTAKTDSSIRTYPLNDTQVAMLDSIKLKQKKARKLYGNCYIHNDYVFKHEDGSTYYPDYPSKAFAKIIKKNPALPQGITFHGLRASCVSILIHEGFDIKSIQKWVGHADINTTLKIYAKVKDKSAKLEISEGMNNLIQPKRYTEK